MAVPGFEPMAEVAAASQARPTGLFERQVRLHPERIAVESARLTLGYAALDRRARRMAGLLAEAGVGHGDRVCILSENDPDFLVLSLAALRVGAVVATLNPRLALGEMEHCIRLVSPRLLLMSDRMRKRYGPFDALCPATWTMGANSALDERLRQPAEADVVAPAAASPEDIQFIIYTSGTTGLPKAAMISQRAMLARLMVYVLDYGVDAEDAFLAWSPLCHMASIELGFGTLLLGGKVVVLDGADLPAICDHLEREKLSNLIFFPGMIEQTLAYLRERRPKARGLKKFGALADLHTPAQIAELTALIGAPFTNTFGSTETGMPPASAGRLAIGEAPRDYAKTPSAMCELRVMRDDGPEADIGETGELAMRGPTLFSGYWAQPEATREVFRHGWYHTGDMFRRRADGRLDYVDRRKYLIKSGGENIYPAEIERVVLRHPAIADAVAVRRHDDRWGEVPVVVAVARGTAPSAEEVVALCREHLAAFKVPKAVHFVEDAFLPRNHTGKVMRDAIERWVGEQA